MKKMKYDTPLTEQERLFAEENHGLLIYYLCKCKLNINDWYGAAAVGYLKAIKRWFCDESTHKNSFYNVAFLYMRAEINNERVVSRRRNVVFISLDKIMTENGKYALDNTITYKNLEYVAESTTRERGGGIPRTGKTKISDEIIAVAEMLKSQEKSICFEYETIQEANRARNVISGARRRKNLQKMYDIKQRKNIVYVTKTDKFLEIVERNKGVIVW